MPEFPNRRDFRVTRALLDKVVYTPDCPGCEAFRRRAGQQSHTHACRDRIEAEMLRDPVLSQRLHSRDIRHGLAPVPGPAPEHDELAEVQRDNGEGRGPE